MAKLIILVMGVVVCAASAHAQPPAINPGAVECGLSGALTIVEGSGRGSIAVDGTYFWKAPGGLALVATEAGYSHVNDLDLLDLSAFAGWTRRCGSTSLYPFANVAGGVRQEWIGSFANARYPVGFDLGLRALVSTRADIRVEYRLRRILNDPVADFTEHEIRLGVALLFRNAP